VLDGESATWAEQGPGFSPKLTGWRTIRRFAETAKLLVDAALIVSSRHLALPSERRMHGIV